MTWDISSLTSNAWFTLFLGIITFLSFIGMIYFYYKSKKEKHPVYSLKSTNVLEDLSGKYEPLKVTYNGTEIKNLTVTLLSFWNSGRDTIRKDDIAAKDPLIIKTKNNVKILDVKMTTPKNKPNGFEYIRSEDLYSLNFTFDYIDKNQGAIFQLLHTGTSRDDIELTGNIIGFGNPEIINFRVFPPKQNLPKFVLKLTNNYKYLEIINNLYTLGFSAFFSVFGIVLIFSQNMFGIILGILCIICGILVLIFWLDSLSNQIPEDFNILDGEEADK